MMDDVEHMIIIPLLSFCFLVFLLFAVGNHLSLHISDLG